MQTLEIEPLAPALGARLHGIDVNHLDDDALAAVHRALLDHEVIVLRAPELTTDQQLALAHRFGDTEVHAFFPNLGPGYERVSVLDSDAGTKASMWHTDETFLDEPPMGTVLHAQIIPPVGGDTCWASQTAAYHALSVPMKRYLDGMLAEHSLSRVDLLVYQNGNADAEATGAKFALGRSAQHPVVRTHPETGHKALFVNPTYTRFLVGVPWDESEAVLALLYRHQIKEEFVYRHHWQEGDLVIWDNRCTLHIALADFTGRRRMHRVSVLGDKPFTA